MENKEEEVHELVPFDPTKKKKKKVVIQDTTEEAEKPAEKSEELPAGDGAEVTFFGMKKKKKKQVDTTFINDEEENLNEEGEGILLGGPSYPWEESDRDYTYDELLGRVFNKLRENNPDMAGDRHRTFMLWPKVLREGTKRSAFVNFMDHCMMMHRQPEHVMAFLLTELGTSGSLDGQQRLVVKGRFPSKNFRSILRKYRTEYVICNGCKSLDTILSKENRLFFVRCEQCGSSRTVMPIKAGFVARVGPRKN
ncbi:eukaryotic translation initiation factor 2 subunit beta-like [Carex rostrata]